MHTFILVEAEVGKARAVAHGIATIEGVTTADVVSGPYDVIVEVETSGFAEAARRVIGEIHELEGVTRTVTCPVVELHEGIGPELTAVYG